MATSLSVKQPWIGFFDTLREMAKLREQKRMVRVIYDYPSTLGSLESATANEWMEMNFDASAGSVSDDNLMIYCGKNRIFNSDKDLGHLSNKEKIERKHRLNLLRISCEERGYLKPTERGWTLTDKGTDLLDPGGIIKAWLGKNGLWIGIVTGAFGLYVLKVILYFFGINIV